MQGKTSWHHKGVGEWMSSFVATFCPRRALYRRAESCMPLSNISHDLLSMDPFGRQKVLLRMKRHHLSKLCDSHA